MTEGKPKIEEGIDFLERQRIRSNNRKRTKLGQSFDGYAIYPEEQIEITAHRALELAKEIIQAHDLDLEKERIRKGEINFGMDKNALANQREEARLMSNESLLRALAFHEKSPRHYSTERIFAIAEKFVSYFAKPIK